MTSPTDTAAAQHAGAPDSDGEVFVYRFGGGTAAGNASMRNLLGGKGANLAEMARLGLPVPPGFTITTEVCTTHYRGDGTFPEAVRTQVNDALDFISQTVGTRFADPSNPLLLSVRSGARVSMPGMMDTVLNLGLNDETVEGLAERSGDARFAYDSYRRFIQMYGDVVMDVDHGIFEDLLENHKNLAGFASDTELSADDWKELIVLFKQAVQEEAGRPFPADPYDQLWGAVNAVFASWQTRRAVTYRRLHDIPDSWGTAVNVQAMVFGNLGETSATGVAFTRNPATGDNEIYGEFLINAQGEDVVAGIRTPQSLTERARAETGDEKPSLEAAMPGAFNELTQVFANLERHYRDMQDIEFTIQDGKLWMLQTRSGKRTTEAALKIAVEMVAEGLITTREAVARIDAEALDQLLHPTIDPEAERHVMGTGLPASPGAASGEIVFTADQAEHLKAQARQSILVRVETSPEDIHGMHAAQGILTLRGGMTSHAAVVARGMGRPCVSGAGTLRIDAAAKQLHAGGDVLNEGDIITIDGSTGQILKGAVPMRQPEMSDHFATLMGWADEIRRLGIRTNADTARDAKQARDFGAEGIGLCRTEHMFFDEDRILAMREMILADAQEGRRAALAKILPMQRADFAGLFETMHGLPVTIRLLDPPLHEFLPHEAKEIAEVAASMGVNEAKLADRVRALSEFNPMLGFRGCRLAIAYPEICEMQARAIIEAAIDAAATTGQPVIPEIMIPLVTGAREFEILADVIDATANTVMAERSATITYQIGTMIELPRACIMGEEIARRAEFFSFGTNDLTQTCYGLSRDDAGPILSTYLEQGVFEQDPFISIDQQGVGALVELGAENGRKARPDIKLGICGEHGGDAKSIDFCERTGLDYVSCSPFRVPIARLAAAQATIRAEATTS